jgi:hypothetical protein
MILDVASLLEYQFRISEYLGKNVDSVFFECLDLAKEGFPGKNFDVGVSVNCLWVMEFVDFDAVVDGDCEVDNCFWAVRNSLEMVCDSDAAVNCPLPKETGSFAVASVGGMEVGCSNLVPHDSPERTVDAEGWAKGFFVTVTGALDWISDFESFVGGLFPMN